MTSSQKGWPEAAPHEFVLISRTSSCCVPPGGLCLQTPGGGQLVLATPHHHVQQREGSQLRQPLPQ